MFKLYLLLLLTFSFQAHAQQKWAALTIKETSGDGTIKFKKLGPTNPWKGILIREKGSKQRPYRVKVLKCNKEACLGKLVVKGQRLEFDKSYEVIYLGEVAQAPDAVLKKMPSKTNSYLYGGYGSALGPAFKLGYGRQILPLLSGGITYAKVSSETSKVALDGNLATLFLRFECIPFTEKLRLFLLGEVGFVAANLEFSANKPGLSQDESTYAGSLAVEGSYAFGDWEASLKSGFSKSGLKESYSSTSGTFANPYGKALGFLEAGLYWHF